MVIPLRPPRHRRRRVDGRRREANTSPAATARARGVRRDGGARGGRIPRRPCVRAAPASGQDGQVGEGHRRRCHEEDAAPGATAATAVVQRLEGVGRGAVGSDRSRARNGGGPDEDDAATGGAAAQDAAGVVAGSGTSTAAHHEPAGHCRKRRTAEAADRGIAVPSVAPAPALAAVAAAAAARVLGVVAGARIRAAPTRVARGAARTVSVGVIIDARRIPSSSAHTREVGGRPHDSFSLEPVRVIARGPQVVSARQTVLSGELLRDASAESEARDVHRIGAEGDRPGGIERHDPSGEPVPGRRP